VSPAELLARGPFAHRGLWSADGPPENSLAAFDAAAHQGFGIEVDARLTADGEAVVFHDANLTRMTGAEGRVRERSSAVLGQLRLAGSDEPIPSLSQALACVAGRTPVLVELKTGAGEEGPLERRVAELLSAYGGAATVLSFNWDALAVVADAAPAILRGLNSSDHVDQNAEVVAPHPYRVLRGLERSRPDFLSLGKELCRGERLSPLPVVAWTIRSAEEQAAVRHASDTFMFERFRP
jgi:glycerophosphoryl diester phosphodiesterase